MAESYRKKADIAYQLNTVPVSSNFWDVNPSNSLSDIYENILNDIEIPNIEERLSELTEESQLILWDKNGKETKDFKTYQKYLNQYESKVKDITDHLKTLNDLFSEVASKNWQEQLAVLNKEKDLALLEFEVKGKKRTVEKILEGTNKSS